MAESRSAAPLEDFPLHGESLLELPRPLPGSADRAPESAGGPAPLGARFFAAAADGACVLLLAAVAILSARLATGRSPQGAGLGWALGFLVYLSLFATVPALVVFGRTVGMAVCDLVARPDGGVGLTAASALRRWIGTLATLATAGLLLLWSRRNPDLPTPADRLSGRTLTLD